jgi:YHS domain-containing protein
MRLALPCSSAAKRCREGPMGLDPVCKSEVNPMSAEAQSEYEGVVFYFCSHACKEQFVREPLRYLDDVDLAEMRAKQASERAA